MNAPFLILALFTLAAAAASVTLRNLVHCALCLAAALVGVAAIFLQLHAEFVGLAQLLVYVGAVAILIVFTILLTRRTDDTSRRSIVGSSAWLGIAVAVLVLGTLVTAIVRSTRLQAAFPAGHATVKEVGHALMSKYILPLEVVGLLLTAAMIGAVVVALGKDGGRNCE